MSSSKGSQPRLGVVVTAVDASAQLEACLREVRAQAEPLGAEVVLAWNGTGRALESFAERAARWVHRTLLEPVPGKSRTLNRAVQECRGSILAFTDDDALPQPGWLASLTEPLLRDPSLAGAGGPVEAVLPACPVPPWFLESLNAGHTSFIGPRHELAAGTTRYVYRERDWHAPIGCNQAYRRAVLLEHPFELGLGPDRRTGLRGGEDFELALRVLRSGGEIAYVPEARVLHPVIGEKLDILWLQRAFYLNGIECARIDRLLDLDEPAQQLASLRARLRRTRTRLVLRGLRRSERVYAHLLREAHLRGRLDELSGRVPAHDAAAHANPGRIPAWALGRVRSRAVAQP